MSREEKSNLLVESRIETFKQIKNVLVQLNQKRPS